MVLVSGLKSRVLWRSLYAVSGMALTQCWLCGGFPPFQTLLLNMLLELLYNEHMVLLQRQQSCYFFKKWEPSNLWSPRHMNLLSSSVKTGSIGFCTWERKGVGSNLWRRHSPAEAGKWHCPLAQGPGPGRGPLGQRRPSSQTPTLSSSAYCCVFLPKLSRQAHCPERLNEQMDPKRGRNP